MSHTLKASLIASAMPGLLLFVLLVYGVHLAVTYGDEPHRDEEERRMQITQMIILARAGRHAEIPPDELVKTLEEYKALVRHHARVEAEAVELRRRTDAPASH